MSTLDEVLPKLIKAKVFSTLDAKDGFYQVGLDEESSLKNSFWTPFGRYRYLRLPSESTWHQKNLNVGYMRSWMVSLVAGNGETLDEANKNQENLVRLLNRARQINLRLNSSKLHLRKSEVRFMGHLITSKGFEPDPDKVKAVEEMPEPTTKQELKSLLGFVNYLSKFLPKLSEVAQPLRDLTVKEAEFIWSTQHAKSFKEIRELVVEHPALKYYDPSEEVTIQCDASEVGLGAALM